MENKFKKLTVISCSNENEKRYCLLEDEDKNIYTIYMSHMNSTDYKTGDQIIIDEEGDVI